MARRRSPFRSRLLLGSDDIAPVAQANFAGLSVEALPPWLDYSGIAGNRMFTDSTGKLTYAPNNMLTYSEDLTDAAWTRDASGTGVLPARSKDYAAAPNGATTATRLVFDLGATPSTAVSRVYQVLPVISATVINSIWLRSTDGVSTYTLYMVGGGGYQSITVTGNWTRIYFTNNTPQIQIGLSGGSSATGVATSTNADILAWGGQVEAVTYQTTPRQYLKSTSAAVFLPRSEASGLLIEESRTNLALQSNNITNASWTKSAVTATISGTSPDGTANASLLTEDTSPGLHRFYQNFTVAAGTYTISLYAKANGRNWVYLYFSGGLAQAYFNVSTGAVGTTTGTSFISAGTQSVGNGWYRINMVVNNTIATAQNLIINLSAVDGNNSYNGNGTSGVYFYGIQLESGAFITSLIPTTSASVTRAADVLKLSGAALTVAGAAAGSAIVQTSSWLNSTAAARDLLSSATTRRLLYSNSSNTVLSSTDGTTRLDATIGGSGAFTGGAVRSAVAWNASGRSLVANNGTLTSDAVNLSTGASVTLGGYGSTTTFNGWIASLALYNQKLPDATLKQKSIVGASY